jgi:hypothetical protein
MLSQSYKLQVKMLSIKFPLCKCKANVLGVIFP